MSATESSPASPSDGGWLERRFQIAARGSTVSRELLGALATFLTLSYILFVQPNVMAIPLSAGGKATPEELAAFRASVLTGLCLASAVACVLMGLLANFPVALAPAMGHNFFFSYTVCLGMGFTWQQALAANVISGTLFLVLSLLGLWVPGMDPRRLLFGAIPRGLQHAIAVGIGLLIALVGFEYAGLVIAQPGTYVGLGIGKVPWSFLAVAFLGLLTFGFFWAKKVKGAPLWAILVAAVVGLALGVVKPPSGVVDMPTLSATAFQLDFGGLFALSPKAVCVVIATFLFLDVFDTVGTLAGVCHRAGLVSSDGELDKGVGGAFVADAAGTVAGAALGTSTITSYVESLAGITAGARTGLCAIGVAALFLLGMFFAPLMAIVADASVVQVGEGPAKQTVLLYPCLAPVLIGIGAVMLPSVKEIDWEDPTEALPAFLCMLGMAFTVSITDGIAFGFISHVVLKVATGRYREVKPFIAVCAALLALRYAM